MVHPRTISRSLVTQAAQTSGEPGPLGVVVYGASGGAHAWIDSELGVAGVAVQTCETIDVVIDALSAARSRPQVLIVDFDKVSTQELVRLHGLRQDGWFGTVFGLGRVPMALRRSLSIERVFAAPFPRHGLRAALPSFAARTVPIARIVSG